MTYIKWKDEVESYLISLPAEERQRIFSYFAEMYADKRDAGKSEAQIIEEFGAPYDVAKRILEGSKDSPPTGGNGAAAPSAGASGGNNYNYNYYNYNYGGAPTGGNADGARQARTENEAPPLPRDGGTRAQQTDGTKTVQHGEKSKTPRKIGTVLLTFLFVFLAICFVGAAITVIVDGFANIGMAIGGMAASALSAGEGMATIGYGLITVGAGFLLLAASTALMKLFNKQLKKFKGEKV